MESSNSFHMDVVKVNTNQRISLSEEGLTWGVKWSLVSHFPIMQYFKLLNECMYSCRIFYKKILLRYAWVHQAKDKWEH